MLKYWKGLDAMGCFWENYSSCLNEEACLENWNYHVEVLERTGCYG
ncbi:hypothetical protein TNCT_66381, partial [Trichonephila clavata]